MNIPCFPIVLVLIECTEYLLNRKTQIAQILESTVHDHIPE